MRSERLVVVLKQLSHVKHFRTSAHDAKGAQKSHKEITNAIMYHLCKDMVPTDIITKAPSTSDTWPSRISEAYLSFTLHFMMILNRKVDGVVPFKNPSKTLRDISVGVFVVMVLLLFFLPYVFSRDMI